jgi:hypothetical protein
MLSDKLEAVLMRLDCFNIEACEVSCTCMHKARLSVSVVPLNAFTEHFSAQARIKHRKQGMAMSVSVCLR